MNPQNKILKYKIGLLLLLTCWINIFFAQVNKVDSLKNVLYELNKRSENSGNDTLKINILFQLVENIYDDNSWPKYNELAYQISIKLKSSNNSEIKRFAQKTLVDVYNNRGYLNKIRGNNKKAIANYYQSLNQAQKINYGHGEASVSLNIATLLSQQKQNDGALKYCLNALQIARKIKDKPTEAISVHFIASFFTQNGQYDSAEVYFSKSIQINESLNDISRLGESYNGLGVIYYKMNKLDAALDKHYKALELFKKIDNQMQLTNTYYNISSILYKRNNNSTSNFSEALSYIDSSLKCAQHINYMEGITDGYLLKSEILYSSSKLSFLSLNDKYKYTQQALEYFKLHKTYSDSIFNEEVLNNTIKQQLNYEFDKKEVILKEQQRHERIVAQEKNRKQKIIIWSIVSVLFLVFGFTIFIWRTLRLTQKQKEIIEKQKELVEEKQKEILDSIHYAKRIQDAILTPQTYIERNLKRLKNNE